MDSVSATTAASAAATGATTAPATPAADTSKTAGGKSFAALFDAAEGDLKKGEKLTKVDGHEFGRIKGGGRDDMCINLSGNARSGQAFDLVWRNGRQFHVYGGAGSGHTVVEVAKKADTTTKTSTDATSKS